MKSAFGKIEAGLRDVVDGNYRVQPIPLKYGPGLGDWQTTGHEIVRNKVATRIACRMAGKGDHLTASDVQPLYLHPQVASK